jgi:pimeloyl-ACP methyl ester carboxylesterase
VVKTRSLLIVVALALAAASCTSSDPEPAATPAPTPAPATTTTAAPATTSPPAPTTTGAAATTTTAGLSSYTPVFEDGRCAFTLPDGYTPRCGYLVVPEDRMNPAGAQVRLHVAVFASTAPDPAPDPVVYLEGGPGGHALEGLEYAFEERFAPFLDQRDVIIFDQRGVGFSVPSLFCPEIRELDIDLLDEVLEPEEYTAREIPVLEACRDRLRADGIDLTQYNSAANAADVADLRRSLGIDEWNLYGISYGTRLALTVMRDDPSGVRSVILDSTVPLQSDLVSSIPASADRAFDAFFAACAASADCAATFPALEDSFQQLQRTLDATAAPVEVTDFLSGESFPGVVTGDDVVGLLFQSLYSEQLIPVLPDVLSDAAAGDYRGLEQLASLFFTNDRFLSIGMYLSVQCNEEYPFSSVAAVEAAVAAHPDTDALFGDIAGEFEECSLWGAGVADGIEDDPVVSDLPTLVLGGVFDPITPPSFGVLAGETLTNDYFFEFPGLGHGVSSAHPCPLAIALAFLDDPSQPPDGSCIAAMGGPRFLTPGRLSVDLVAFEEEVFDILVTGVVPEGWDAAGFGQYTAPGLGDTAVVQQARALTPGLTLESLAGGLQDFFVVDAWTRTTYTSTRSWEVFEGSDGETNFLIALAEDDGLLLTVILASPPDLAGEYRSLVFIPALDAIEASA